VVRLLWLALAAVVGCSGPADWTPRAEAKWVQWREADADGARSGVGVCSISNVGLVALTSVDVAAVVTTDKDEYYLQFQSAVELEPGKSSFQTVEVKYRSPSERATLDHVRLVSVSAK